MLKQSNVIAFVTDRSQNMSFVYGSKPSTVGERQKVLQSYGVDYRDIVCAQQVHGVHIVRAQKSDRGRGALSHEDAFSGTDAIITDEKNLPLAVFTADCLSVFLYDPLRKAIGLVHAGWKGSRENIVSKTVLRMQEEFGSLPAKIIASFGPCIRSCCYEVGADFLPDFKQHLKKNREKLYFDLPGTNRKQLIDTGVAAENIFDEGACTSCRIEKYFSFRREGAGCGRMMSVAMLK